MNVIQVTSKSSYFVHSLNSGSLLKIAFIKQVCIRRWNSFFTIFIITTDAQAPVAVRALQPATKPRLILIYLYHVTELLLSLLASIIRGCVVSLQTHTEVWVVCARQKSTGLLCSFVYILNLNCIKNPI